MQDESGRHLCWPLVFRSDYQNKNIRQVHSLCDHPSAKQFALICLMSNNDDKRRNLILDALARKAAVDGATIDDALWPWKRLAAHLTPLIGEAGFCALYGRALRLRNSEFQWMTAMQSGQSIDVLLGTLRENFQSVDTRSAAHANMTLLDTYTGLLAALIGEMLTMRLLSDAWGSGSDGQEHTGDK